MSIIKLNFVNQSNDQNNSDIVIFQKNVATDFDEIAVAWKVIRNCATGWHHSIDFPLDVEISAADSWENEIVKPIPVNNGDLYHVYKDYSGDQLAYSGPSGTSKEIHLRNDLSLGSIDARVYKDGKLLAVKTGISPAQKAVFEFKPTIWIGVVAQVQQGSILNSAIISEVNTEISLLGISSADIVMTGGGTGEKATKFEFTLENIRYS